MTMNKSVLLVDDDLELLEVLRALLVFEGFSVLTAGNGKEALELLENSETPGVIFTDIMMPVMDGNEFLAILKSHPTKASIPVVIISAHLEATSVKGANAILGKPFLTKPFLVLAKTYCT